MFSGKARIIFSFLLLTVCIWSAFNVEAVEAAPGITAEAIDEYLRSKGSPLAGYGNVFVSEGRRYSVDPRLIVAMAGSESTFGTTTCQDKPATEIHNAWGYMHWPQGIRTCLSFATWQAGIRTVTWQIGAGNNYFTAGRYTIEEIGRTYCGQTCNNWIRNATTFYVEMGGDTSNLRFVELQDAPQADAPQQGDNTSSTKQVTGYKLPWDANSSNQPYQVAGVRTSHTKVDNIPRQSIDFGTPFGTSIVAMRDGIATYSMNIGGDTNSYVVIDHQDGLCSVYMHLSSLSLGTFTSGNAFVSQGQEVGKSGRGGPKQTIHTHIAVYEKSGSSCGAYGNADKKREVVIIFDEIGRELNYNDWVTSQNQAGDRDEPPAVIQPSGDQYEPDGIFTQSTSISTNGTRQAHSIHQAGDEDWIRFTAFAGRRYIIEAMNLQGDTDTFIGLFWNNDGHTWLIESDDDDGSSSLASLIDWTATDTATFYVKVRNLNEDYGNENATYDIRIRDLGRSQASNNTRPDDRSGSVTSNGLNVRAGPGTGYRVLGQLGRNQSVTIQARNSNATWYQIDFSPGPDDFGWVSARYITTSANDLPVSDRISSVPANSSPAPSTASSAPSQQRQNAGNMDRNRYCQGRGFDEAALEEHTAYGWYCRSGNGNRSGMDLEVLCRQQHSSGYRPEYTNFNDPYSWRCIATNTASAPVPAQPQPAPQPQAPPRRTVTHYQVEVQEWRCGSNGIIALGLTPDGARRLKVSLIKCPTTSHAGKFGSSGHYWVRIDGERRYRFNYSEGHSMFVETINPAGDGYPGNHSYQIELYPNGQQEPIWSGVHRAWDIEVQE